jgi:AcrR family transcriptional regulator
MVDAILDGALRAITSASESSSINRIAEIAGVSIGSLYQYFPGKTAIIAALVRRRIRHVHERLHEVIDESSGLSLEEAIPRIVDCLFEMKLSNVPGERAMLRETLRHAILNEALTLDAELARRFSIAIERWKPKVHPDVPSEVAAHILFHSLRGVMVTGTESRPDLIADVRMREEVKRLLLSYLKSER